MQQKERPILLTAVEVRAILNGSKTQIRRPVKKPPPDTDPPTEWVWMHADDLWLAYDAECPDEGHYDTYTCPFGEQGDLLWGREAWHKRLWPFDGFFYRATNDKDWDPVLGWRSSTHMPKEAVRIWMRVKDVRVERLRDISRKDATDMGATSKLYPWSYGEQRIGWSLDWSQIGTASKHTGLPLTVATISLGSPQMAVGNLWNKQHKTQWEENPWVWVVDFERIER